MNIEELYNILLSNKTSDRLLLNESKIFEMIPELKLCKGFNQNNEWHIYDVYEHILHVVDYVPSDVVLKLTALFHDVGKPLSYVEDDFGIGHFYGHWKLSQKIFDSFANKYKIDNNIRNLVSNLIYYHDVNMARLSDNDLDKIYSIFRTDGIEMLYEFKKADLLAQNKKYHYILNDYNNQKRKILCKYK